MKASKVKKRLADLPGISYEKSVAAIQSLLDPAAVVTHNEIIVDKLGHSRQFDVVIRGAFAAQKMLGVVECKDLGRRVGTPEVDAFVTKSNDINANFKMIMSRKGFTKPALEKCRHYGVKALSLVPHDGAEQPTFIGTYWAADLKHWDSITVSLFSATENPSRIEFLADQVLIRGARAIDWFKNRLKSVPQNDDPADYSITLKANFIESEPIQISVGNSYLCSAIAFTSTRVTRKMQKLVGIRGPGFFDWNTSEVSFPANSTIASEGVPMDFSLWDPRSSENLPSSNFIDFKIFVSALQFEDLGEIVDLESIATIECEEAFGGDIQ